MFRVLGELVVCWILAGVALWYIRRKLRPWRHRRHMSRIEEENRELDSQLSNIVDIRPREKTK